MNIDAELRRLISMLRERVEPDPSNRQWVLGFEAGRCFAAAEIEAAMARCAPGEPETYPPMPPTNPEDQGDGA